MSKFNIVMYNSYYEDSILLFSTRIMLYTSVLNRTYCSISSLSVNFREKNRYWISFHWWSY